MSLKPCRFNRLSNQTQIVDGFLAHEVRYVVPAEVTGVKDAIDEEGNPVLSGIDQSKLSFPTAAPG